MTIRTRHIFEEALGLPAKEKALSKSIDEMWARESENRIDAYERGEIRAISVKEVFEKIDKKKK